MTFKPRPISSPRHFAFGFTLIEVTISVALAVVLMLGISQVFKIVGDTVGTGQALAVAQRDGRSAQVVMNGDFNSAVTDGAPFMTLNAQQVFAFSNASDLAASKKLDPSYADLAGVGTESLLSAALYNSRSHRTDQFTFLGRGSFSRQTGAYAATSGASPFVSTLGSTEALLWYGHLNLANNSGTFLPASGISAATDNSPGFGTTTLGNAAYFGSVNQNNFFASSWILGRQQIILQPATTLDNNYATLMPATVIDQSYPNGNKEYAYNYTSASPLTPPLAPLSYNSLAYKSAGVGSLQTSWNGAATALSSRIDVASTSIQGFYNILSSYIPTNTVAPFWWQVLPGGANNMRFQAQPFFLPPAGALTKVTPEALAYQAPIFVRGCTQFTVEYAGDYLNQSPIGATVANQGITDTYIHADGTAGATDGQIDYVYVSPPVPAVGGIQNIVRQIRWYGLPRSTTNGATINGLLGDVVPLRDIFAAVINVGTVAKLPPPLAPFESVVPALPSPTPGSVDYAPVNAMASGAQYICAWGPNDRKPKMIRITMTIDDPGGRLGDGQTFEYIYTLP